MGVPPRQVQTAAQSAFVPSRSRSWRATQTVCDDDLAGLGRSIALVWLKRGSSIRSSRFDVVERSNTFPVASSQFAEVLLPDTPSVAFGYTQADLIIAAAGV